MPAGWLEAPGQPWVERPALGQHKLAVHRPILYLLILP
jgi:hypothetical protein